LSPRPNWADPIAWDFAIEQRAEEILGLLSDDHTHVYVAGLKPIREAFDDLFSNLSGSADAWAKTKAKLVEQGRWAEVLY
jgi:ferredoxin--NADP+ reductase